HLQPHVHRDRGSQSEPVPGRGGPGGGPGVLHQGLGPATEQFWISRFRRCSPSVISMITGISIHPVYVLDQQEALDFYVGKLGFEVSADVDLGFMRWLTVAPAAQPDREILLEVPAPPRLPEATAATVRELLT